jgi:hypothetical protein
MENPLRTSAIVSEQLLVDALAGDERARGQLFENGERLVHKMAVDADEGLRRRGLSGDVVSRTFELLLKRPAGHFDPTRGTVQSYLRSVVATAARDVRAENVEPGVRTRDYWPAWDEQPEPGDRTWNTHQLRTSAPEPSTDYGLARVDTEVSIDQTRVDSSLVKAARLIGFDDANMVEAAELTGVNRFMLKRALVVWATQGGREVLIA